MTKPARKLQQTGLASMVYDQSLHADPLPKLRIKFYPIIRAHAPCLDASLDRRLHYSAARCGSTDDRGYVKIAV
jgi:hypothetical protein